MWSGKEKTELDEIPSAAHIHLAVLIHIVQLDRYEIFCLSDKDSGIIINVHVPIFEILLR